MESYCGYLMLLLYEFYFCIGRIVLFFEEYIEVDKKRLLFIWIVGD